VTGLILSLLISPASAEVQFDDSYVMRPPNKAVHSAVAVTKINNLNAHDIELTGMSSPDADKVEFHLLEHNNGIVSMTRQTKLHIAGNAQLELHKGGLHIMLMSLSERFFEQSSIEITFFFSGGDHLQQTFLIVNASQEDSEQLEHEHQ